MDPNLSLNLAPGSLYLYLYPYLYFDTLLHRYFQHAYTAGSFFLRFFFCLASPFFITYPTSLSSPLSPSSLFVCLFVYFCVYHRGAIFLFPVPPIPIVAGLLLCLFKLNSFTL